MRKQGRQCHSHHAIAKTVGSRARMQTQGMELVLVSTLASPGLVSESDQDSCGVASTIESPNRQGRVMVSVGRGKHREALRLA